MFRSKVLIIALCMVWGSIGFAYAAEELDETEGALLYSTHCKSCHTEKIHWREQRLATDWPSLKFQVRRWQSNTGLDWNEEQITVVARYLNTLHYRFKLTGQKDISQDQRKEAISRR
jgi:mono/diheme cytochrome c family protein